MLGGTYLCGKMTSKLRSKIVLESQDSGFEVVEAAHEGLVPAIKEQLEKNVASFLQEEHALDNVEGTCNIDVPIL